MELKIQTVPKIMGEMIAEERMEEGGTKSSDKAEKKCQHCHTGLCIVRIEIVRHHWNAKPN